MIKAVLHSIYGEPAWVERYSRAMVSIGLEHAMVHSGRLFFASHIFSSVADANAVDCLFVCGARFSHLDVSIAHEGNCTVALYEEPTYSSAGTALTVTNRRRPNPSGSGSAVYHTPTISGTGNQLGGDRLLPGGTKNFAVGGQKSTRNEIILRPRTAYLIRVTNTSGGAISIGVEFDWYDEKE